VREDALNSQGKQESVRLGNFVDVDYIVLYGPEISARRGFDGTVLGKTQLSDHYLELV